MTAYIIRRIIWFFPVLISVGLITFLIAHSTPGGPFDTDPNRPGMSKGAVQKMQKQFGLNLPLWHQFTRYMFFDIETQIDPKTKQPERKIVWGAIGGNLGPSYQSKGSQTVQDFLFKGTSGNPSRFAYSARLGLQALMFALVIGIPLGVIAALNQNTWIDYLALAISTTFAGIPTFILSLFMIVIFAVGLGWFTVIPNWDDPVRPWVLPTLALGIGTMAYITRLTRTSVLEVKRQDFVRTARAKGLADMAVIARHILRNALLPIVTIMGPLLAALLTGAFFTELIFQVPGMGRVLLMSIERRDYSMIMGLALFYTFILTLGNLLVDLMYGVVDPRISVK